MRGIETLVANFSGAFPDALGVNSSGPSTKDGTELIANLFNDYIGIFPQALLNEMGLTPDGNAETSTDNQQMMALIGMIQRYGSAYGCIGSADTDTLHDVQISVGQVPDSTRAYTLRLTSAIAKQGDVAWAAGGTPGTPAGGLMGGAWSANTEYGVYLIYNPTTKVTDAGFSVYTGAGVPTFLPVGFTVWQLVDWVKTDGSSQIIQTLTRDLGAGSINKYYTTPILDINSVALTTARQLDAISVPTGFDANAILNVLISDASANVVAYVYTPYATDQAPSSAASPLYTVINTTAGGSGVMNCSIMTNTSRQIAARASAAIDNYRVATLGFVLKRF